MTRRQLLHLLTAAPALAVTGCTAQSASSQQEKPLILRYSENQPEDYPTSKAAKAFAELVAQHTDGRVKVLTFSLAVLIGRGLDHKISLVSCVVYTLTRLVILI